MPPRKRRSTPGNAEHHGRVTRPVDRTTLPRAAEEPLTGRSQPRGERDVAPTASSRYTPPVKSVRFRPDWHKAVGALVLVLGVALAVINDVMMFGVTTTLLPGGHQEVYLLLGMAIAGYSTWWFGWFDRER